MDDSNNQDRATMKKNNWQGLDASSFYRIIAQPVFDEGKLGLPENFVKEYSNEISSNVRLNVPSGGSFHVGIERDENMLWICDGWRRFAEHHSITYGYFLWFKYKGNSEFDVAIFDLSATEIDYPSCSNSSKRITETAVPQHDDFFCHKTDDHHPLQISLSSESEDEEIRDVTEDFLCRERDDLHPIEILSSSETEEEELGNVTTASGKTPSIRRSRRRAVSDKEKTDSGKTCSIRRSRRGAVSNEEKMLERDVVTRLFKSDNPYFSVTLKPYHLKRFLVNVPAEFSSTYLRDVRKSVELQDLDGNKWTVGTVVRAGRITSLTKGWCYFCRDKMLCVRDVCIFEVIKSSPVVFRVSIFSAK